MFNNSEAGAFFGNDITAGVIVPGSLTFTSIVLEGDLRALKKLCLTITPLFQKTCSL